jgi:hypothetical protein
MLCPKGSLSYWSLFLNSFQEAIDLGSGRSHRGKHMFLSEMNSFHLDIMEVGGMRP